MDGDNDNNNNVTFAMTPFVIVPAGLAEVGDELLEYLLLRVTTLHYGYMPHRSDPGCFRLGRDDMLTFRWFVDPEVRRLVVTFLREDFDEEDEEAIIKISRSCLRLAYERVRAELGEEELEGCACGVEMVEVISPDHRVIYVNDDDDGVE
jgi:hypothetical protein